MLSTDGRDEIDTGLLADSRVRQFWDEERVSGRWFADSSVGELGDQGGIVWDAFYVFGPDAAWNEEPGPVAGDGTPVISETSRLESALAAHLARD
jgi:hypothetical protein